MEIHDTVLGKMNDRGISEEQAFKAWKSGKSYYDPVNDSYIRYDPKTGTAVVLTEDGIPKSVYEGGPGQDWIASDWTPPQQ